MTSIQITSEIDIDQLIASVAQLETSELEVYAEKISLLVAQRKAASLSAQEANLLKTISRSLPADVEARHTVLQDKVHNETITAIEHKELIALIKLVEQAESGRLEALFALSQIRQVSLPTLMEQLGIKPPPIHA